jgi:hypothetical protein
MFVVAQGIQTRSRTQTRSQTRSRTQTATQTASPTACTFVTTTKVTTTCRAPCFVACAQRGKIASGGTDKITVSSSSCSASCVSETNPTGPPVAVTLTRPSSLSKVFTSSLGATNSQSVDFNGPYVISYTTPFGTCSAKIQVRESILGFECGRGAYLFGALFVPSHFRRRALATACGDRSGSLPVAARPQQGNNGPASHAGHWCAVRHEPQMRS